MKKIFTFACAAIMMVACSNSEQQEAKLPDNFKHYETEKIAIDYPQEWGNDQLKDDQTKMWITADMKTTLNVEYIADGPKTEAELKELADKDKALKDRNPDAKNDPLKIEGNTFSFKSVENAGEDNEATIHYFYVMGENGAGVSGSIRYPKDKATEAEPFVEPIIKSVKAK